MKFTDFLANAPVQRGDLFGPWHQKRVHLDEDEADGLVRITAKLNWIRNRFAERAASLNIPDGAEVQFKRADVGGRGDGEWALILIDGKPFKCFTASAAGFCEAPVSGEKPAPAPQISATSVKKAPMQKETRTQKEIQAAVPFELRTGWIDYDYMDKINAQVCEETVAWWNKKHPGMY